MPVVEPNRHCASLWRLDKVDEPLAPLHDAARELLPERTAKNLPGNVDVVLAVFWWRPHRHPAASVGGRPTFPSRTTTLGRRAIPYGRLPVGCP